MKNKALTQHNIKNINLNIIKEVYSTLELRRDSPTDSYTSNIMKNSEKQGEDKILEKIGEESAEVIIASKNNENLVEETADLIFHTLLLLVKKKIPLEELLKEFEKRHYP